MSKTTTEIMQTSSDHFNTEVVLVSFRVEKIMLTHLDYSLTEQIAAFLFFHK